MSSLEKVKIQNQIDELNRKLKSVVRKNTVKDLFPKPIKRTYTYKKGV